MAIQKRLLQLTSRNIDLVPFCAWVGESVVDESWSLVCIYSKAAHSIPTPEPLLYNYLLNGLTVSDHRSCLFLQQHRLYRVRLELFLDTLLDFACLCACHDLILGIWHTGMAYLPHAYFVDSSEGTLHSVVLAFLGSGEVPVRKHERAAGGPTVSPQGVHQHERVCKSHE